MPPAARITDMHVCPMQTPGTPPIPHVGGPIVMGEPTVITGYMPQARMGDMAICVGPPDSIAVGSPSVLVGGMMAARIGDASVHGGAITTGFTSVMIGESGSGSGGGGAGAGGPGMGGMPNPPKPAAQFQAMTASAQTGKPFQEICP